MGSPSLTKLPVIDFSNEKLKPGTNCWLSACNNVVHALEKYGCFVAKYDKVPSELYNAMFNSLENLFHLPLEIKRKNVSEIPYNGYVGNQPFVPPLYEGMGIDNGATLEGTQNFTTIMWPNGNDDFCQPVLSFSKIVAELEQMVVKMVFDNYEVKGYESHKALTTYLFRMMKYRVPNENEDDLGCNVHTDKSFITVLHQKQVAGLEVKTKDGEWIGFDPSPLSYIVLAGDAILAWSNGKIHAAEHRVMMSGNEIPRYSVGLFSFCKGLIEVPKELIDEKHPLRFKPFDNFGLLHYFLAAQKRGLGMESSIQAYCGV